MNNTDKEQEEEINILESDPIFIVNRGPTDGEYTAATELETPIIVFVTEEECPHAEDYNKWRFENIPPLRYLNCHYVRKALLKHVINEAKMSFREDREERKKAEEKMEAIKNPLQSLFNEITKKAKEQKDKVEKEIKKRRTEDGFEKRNPDQVMKELFGEDES